MTTALIVNAESLAPFDVSISKRTSTLGQPLAAVLTAAAVTGAAGLRGDVAGFGRQQCDEVIACVMPALRPPGRSQLTRAGTAASTAWLPTAPHGSGPGWPVRRARTATGRSNCPTAARASYAARSARS